MKTVTLEEFKKFGPCWLGTAEGREKLEAIGSRQEAWTALDVLELEEVSVEDKLWAVLRPEFIPEETLHEFACRCAEEALKLVENPDPRSVAAIEAKRRWLRGEIGDEELSAARSAAWAAESAVWAAESAAWAAARSVARDAALSATLAARAAAKAAWAARSAADAAADAAMAAARSVTRSCQVEMLKDMLKEETVVHERV